MKVHTIKPGLMTVQEFMQQLQKLENLPWEIAVRIQGCVLTFDDKPSAILGLVSHLPYRTVKIVEVRSCRESYSELS